MYRKLQGWTAFSTHIIAFLSIFNGLTDLARNEPRQIHEILSQQTIAHQQAAPEQTESDQSAQKFAVGGGLIWLGRVLSQGAKNEEAAENNKFQINLLADLGSVDKAKDVSLALQQSSEGLIRLIEKACFANFKNKNLSFVSIHCEENKSCISFYILGSDGSKNKVSFTKLMDFLRLILEEKIRHVCEIASDGMNFFDAAKISIQTERDMDPDELLKTIYLISKAKVEYVMKSSETKPERSKRVTD